MRRSWLIIVTVFLLFAQSPDVSVADQKISPEVRQAAGQLAVAMGTADLMRQTLDLIGNQIVAAINNQSSAANGRTAVDEIIMPELSKGSDEMTALIGDVYASHFSLEELNKLRAFYETPLGRKTAREMPMIIAEADRVGDAWGEKTILEIFKERAEDLRAPGVALPR